MTRESASVSPVRRRARTVKVLERRRDYLIARIGNEQGDQSYQRAELAALRYALGIIEAAIAEDVIADLEHVKGIAA